MKERAVKERAMKEGAVKIRPTTRRTLRALGGRRVVIEGFGRRSPAFVAIMAGGTAPIGAWLSRAELRRLVDVVRRILK